MSGTPIAKITPLVQARSAFDDIIDDVEMSIDHMYWLSARVSDKYNDSPETITLNTAFHYLNDTPEGVAEATRVLALYDKHVPDLRAILKTYIDDVTTAMTNATNRIRMICNTANRALKQLPPELHKFIIENDCDSLFDDK